MPTLDHTIVGGGIVGLAAAWQLGMRRPGRGSSCSKRNPNSPFIRPVAIPVFIYSGIYYKPGSFKARFAKARAESMVDYPGIS
jgi:L-2-hydroxyglutarate oxidase